MQFPTGGYSPRPISSEIAESVKFRYRQYSLDREDGVFDLLMAISNALFFPVEKEGILSGADKKAEEI